MTDSLDRAIEAIDQQIAEMAPAASSGRSRLARRRLEKWSAHQVHGQGKNSEENVD